MRFACVSSGFAFRRQHVLAPYVVDFFVASCRLVIEVDGGYHASPEQQLADAHRERELVRLHGVRILRFAAALVEAQPAAVVSVIRAAL